MTDKAIEILDSNRMMTIATVRPDGWPQATIVGYANAALRLYFLVYRTSQKFSNIMGDPRVAVSIGAEPKALQEIRAVYAGCLAQEVADLAERGRAWELLARRHPNLTDLAPPASDEVATMAADCRHLSVLDYRISVGYSETFEVEA